MPHIDWENTSELTPVHTRLEIPMGRGPITFKMILSVMATKFRNLLPAMTHFILDISVEELLIGTSP